MTKLDFNYYIHTFLYSKYKFILFLAFYFICIQMHYLDFSNAFCAPTLSNANHTWLIDSQSEQFADKIKKINQKDLIDYYNFYKEDPKNAVIYGLREIQLNDPEVLNNVQARYRGIIMWSLRDFFYKQYLDPSIADIETNEPTEQSALLARLPSLPSEPNFNGENRLSLSRLNDYCSVAYNSVWTLVGIVGLVAIVSLAVGYNLQVPCA